MGDDALTPRVYAGARVVIVIVTGRERSSAITRRLRA
jgi:hypothetical protein